MYHIILYCKVLELADVSINVVYIVVYGLGDVDIYLPDVIITLSK